MRFSVSSQGSKDTLLANGKGLDSYSVLLVDDSDDDRMFLRRAFRGYPGFRVVEELRDGDAAIEYLAGRGKYDDRKQFPYPDVLMLDLKMPRKTGHEVLAWLQGSGLPRMCIVVLSGSFLPKDITRSRELGADAYFTKEALFEEQKAMVAEIEGILKNC